MKTHGHREALLELLEHTRLPRNEVSARLVQAMNPTYWKNLNPSLSIDRKQHAENIEVNPLSNEEQAELVERFALEGFFKLDSLLSDTETSELTKAIEVVKEAGWPPVFGFVYDQFWLALRPPSLMRLLTAILGAGYRQSWHLWSHYVRSKRGASGWPAHVDNYQYPGRVTVWIPLRDAKLDNGCLCLIPKDLVSDSILERLYGAAEVVPTADLQAMLQGAEVLPASAGSVLGWQHDVIHWGSCHRGRQNNPRISITSEFISADAKTRPEEMSPLGLADGLPVFEQRLYAIASEILLYQKAETLLIRYVELAQQIIAATRAEAAPLLSS